jgi:hypothetical protein
LLLSIVLTRSLPTCPVHRCGMLPFHLIPWGNEHSNSILHLQDSGSQFETTTTTTLGNETRHKSYLAFSSYNSLFLWCSSPNIPLLNTREKRISGYYYVSKWPYKVVLIVLSLSFFFLLIQTYNLFQCTKTQPKMLLYTHYFGWISQEI